MEITTPTKFIESYQQLRLHPGITPEQIQAVLPSIRDEGLSGDGKVQNHWSFLADGQECAIWDYRDLPWSAYGPREVFEQLGLEVIGGVQDISKHLTLLKEVRS